jgi:hypothetical protein
MPFTKQYIIWCVMLAFLIIAAFNVAVALVTIFLYAWGVTLVGLKVTIPFLLAWFIIFIFPYRWFTEAA